MNPQPSPGTTGHPQCTAKSKRSGERCKCYPMRGGRVCKTHGGKAPAVMAAAQRRLAAQVVEAEVDAELAYASIEPVTNPFEALAQLTSEVLAMKESLGARVNALTTLRYSAAGSGTEQLRAEVALLERAQDRAGRFLDLLARSGFEERRVRVSEQQGALMVVVLHRIFDRLELSAAQRLLIPVVVPQEFRVAIAAEPHRGQDRAR